MSKVNQTNIIKVMKSQITITLLIGILASLSFYLMADTMVEVKISDVQSDRKSRAKDAIKYDFSNSRNSYLEAVEIAKMLPSKTFASMDNYKFHNKKISSLFWIRAKDLVAEGNVEPIPFLNHYAIEDLNKHMVKSNIDKIRGLYKVFSKKDLGVIKSISSDAIITRSIENGWEQGNRAVLLTSLIRAGNGEIGILVGVVDVKDILSNTPIYEELGVASISINLGGEGSLFYMSKDQDVGAINSYFSKNKFESSFAHSEFKQVYTTDIRFHYSYLEMLLMLIPLAVAMSLLCFTLSYAFIRYLNIRRTNEMRSLNEGLAYKNVELKGAIKKREAMNFAIRQSEQENKAIINSISDVIFEMNTDYEIMFINETWHRVTGYDVAHAIKTKLFSYLEEGEAKIEEEKVKKLLNGEITAYSSFYRIRSIDGHLKPVEMTISMLRKDKGNNLRIVGTITDLEEKEKAEQAIEQAEENYKRIWKNAANGIYEVSLSGKLMSANPAMAMVLGYDDTEQLIRAITNMSEIIYVTPNEKLDQIKIALKDGKTKKFEIKAHKKDGEEIWLEEFMQTVTDESGKIIRFEGVIDDITERKRAGQELIRAKAESDMANRAKSDFLANMSHELRTPLNSIIGFAEIIKDEVMGEIKEPVYIEYAEEIHKSGTGLLSIINQILDVSKIEAGDRELNESLVKLKTLSSDTLKLFSAKITEKQIDVANNIDDELSDLIAEDRSVRQMLYNIMSNAVKFTPNNGRISIEASVDDDNNMRVSISDNGDGLTPDQLERALRPFDLLDGEHSREKYGAGLGLTLVKLLMDMHGGFIDMQSEKGVGTTVVLVFPSERVRGGDKNSSESKSADEANILDMGNFEGADIFSDSGSDSVH